MKMVLMFMLFLYNGICLAESFPKDSVYHLADQWQTSEDTSISLKQFAGKPVVIAMTYTGCQFSCPMTFKKLGQIEKDLKEKGVKNYLMVVASFDSEKDKPAVLKAYMEKNNYDTKNWSFITAKSDQVVRQLAVVLGISYQKIEGGDFSHSNEINLLNADGVPVVKLKGVNSPHNDIIQKILQIKGESK